MSATSNMSFNTFCNICFMKENIIKLSEEENESIINILISFTSCPDIVNGNIYLCVNCSNKLEEYDKFRELYLTNFVRFRYLYNEHKKQLEIRNEPDIETQLKTFVEINVERPSGTPLIEHYKTEQSFRNNSPSHVDIICRESDEEFLKIDLDQLLNKNDLSDSDTTFIPENNILENERYTYYENDSSNEDQESIHGSSIAKKSEPFLLEAYNELTNTDTVATSISCSSSTCYENCNLSTKQNFSEIEDSNLEDEPKPNGFEESNDQFMSDTSANIIQRRKSSDYDISDLSTNSDSSTTGDTTDEEGPTDKEYQVTEGDTECNVCNKRFSCNSYLIVHMRTHTSKRHQRSHSSKRPYKCEECGLRFTRRNNLNRHKRLHTGEKPYSCDECNKTFTDTTNLIRHKRVHSGERPHKCDKCGLGFTERFKLNKHKHIHHGERPYSCDECNKKFTKISNLTKHKRIHIGERPYKCDECGLGFKQRSHLNSHKRTHTGERPYHCDECHKKFTDNSKLINHKRIHTGERPYKCDECGLRFTERSTLNKHKRVHTHERPYSCDECQKTFTNTSNLIKHKRIHSCE